MHKLLFIDIDGTLVANRKKFLPSRTLLALQKLLRQNIQIALVSGRSLEHILPIAQQLNLHSQKQFLLGAYNGSLIYDFEKRRTLFESLIDPFIVNQIDKCARKVKVNCISYSNLKNRTIITTKKNSFLVKKLSKITGLPFLVISPSRSFFQSYKILIISLSGSKLDSIQKYLTTLDLNIEISRTTRFVLEITNSGIDKGFAGKKISNKLGINLSECLAIGDSANDLPLMKIVNYSVAMGNASIDVKRIANITINSQKKEGIVNFLKSKFEEIFYA